MTPRCSEGRVEKMWRCSALLLDRLERSGLIVRKRNATDQRMVHIELTAAGNRLALPLLDAHVENCRAMLARLSTADREALVRIAEQIVRSRGGTD
jgi:DNA-binding MarR family transcriptional regulator